MTDQLVIAAAKGITILAQANADLHRQIDELRQTIEYIAQVALDALGCDRVRTDRLEAQRIIVDKRRQVRAALANITPSNGGDDAELLAEAEEQRREDLEDWEIERLRGLR